MIKIILLLPTSLLIGYMGVYSLEEYLEVNILDIEVDRNAYGRQVNSFTDKLSIYIEGISKNITATFIRAPKINKMGKEIEIISSYNNEPVAVKQGIHMGLAFHPELDGITLLHEFIFVKQLNKKSHAA